MAKQSRRISTKLPTRRQVPVYQRKIVQIGRNDLCPCGSGKKYKRCHQSEGQTFLDKLALEQARQELGKSGQPWYKRWLPWS